MSKPLPRRFKMEDYVINRLKLRPLVIFDTVLQTRSVVQAAMLLNISQPAVTKAIKELENQLDTELFKRTNKGMHPTKLGEILGERIKILLAEMRYLADDINNFQQAELGHVVVGTLLSGSAHLVPEAINALKQQAPSVRITVKNGTSEVLYPALQRGEIDLVVGRLPEKSSRFYRAGDFEHITLYQEQLCWVVGAHHPLLDRSLIALEDLLSYPLILPLKSTAMRAMIISYFNEHGLAEPTNLIESVSILTNINILTNSLAICCMSDVVAQQLEQFGLVKQLAAEQMGDSVAVGYSYRKAHYLSPAVKRFLNHIHNFD